MPEKVWGLTVWTVENERETSGLWVVVVPRSGDK